MRRLFICLVSGFFAIASFSQSSSIKGTVTDTSDKKNLHNSVVALLRKSDSVLVNFTRSNTEGNFNIKNISAGNYILMITRPTYAGFVDSLSLAENENRDLGSIILTQTGKLLEEVIVKQNRAIMIKGDTVEYKADSFKVAEGANVQEMLKRMPGLEVDRNGQITAHGKKVEKVLVDGEEFFSDDPAVVTQNLRADAIDKVQSFDKKSDQAEFTGVDDGVRSKTLNLVLKEDKKKGYFGKLSLGAGTRERYSNEAMVNFFKGRKKASVYGIMSNTGKIGLDWDSREKFGGGMDFGDATMEVGSGFIMFSGGSDREFSDFNESYWGEGVPRNLKTGAHFSNKWNKDKNHITGNYSLNRQKNNAEGGSLTKYILPDSAYYFRENHRNFTSQQRQLFSGFYDFKLDSFSSIRIRLNGTVGYERKEQFTNSGSDDENLQPVNNNRRDNISDVDTRVFMASVLWKQRLKKEGRTLSWSVSHKYGDRVSEGFLNSITDYYDGGGVVIDRDSIDQFKKSFSKNLSSQSRIVYTEPLSKKTILELNYSIGRNSNLSDRESFDKATNGKYELLNNVFSSHYTLQYLSNSGGFKFQYNAKKFSANIGTNLGVANYMHKDSAGKELNNFRYTNLLPSSRITYRFSPQRSLNFNYNGNSQPPSIEQIQPISENIDPLNITIGNPDLKQAFNHNLSLFFNDFKPLTGNNIWINASYNIRQNAIVTSQVIDAGKRTSQYVNTNGNSNFWFNASYGFKLKKPEMNLSIRTGASGSKNVSFVNNLENKSNNIRYNIGTNLYRYKENKFNLSYGNNFSWNRNVSSISTTRSTFWTQNHNFGFDIYIKKKWEFGSDLNIELREKVDAFDLNNNVYDWSAYVTRKVFKKNNGALKLQLFDILDQKLGFERSISSNYVLEKTYEVLRQYFLLSFTWEFTKNPGEK
jgi:hypothetical protein